MTSRTVRPFSSSLVASSQTRTLRSWTPMSEISPTPGMRLQLLLEAVLEVIGQDPGRHGARPARSS